MFFVKFIDYFLMIFAFNRDFKRLKRMLEEFFFEKNF